MHSISVGYRFPKSLCARESHLGGEIGPIGEPSDPFRNVRHVYFLAQNGGELTVITSSYGGRKGGRRPHDAPHPAIETGAKCCVARRKARSSLMQAVR